MATHRLGIDIGGTFTDGALVDEASGDISIIKVPTTPENPADGFMHAVQRAARNPRFSAEGLTLLVHATTIATNAIIEGNTAPVGMIATEGFRDVLEIGYQIRPRLYDVFQRKPTPLVPRRWSYGVRERLDAAGNVLEPLDEEGLLQAVRELRGNGIEAIVVCFLHSYINPVHENRAAELIRAEYPQAHLSVSSEVCPEFREFPRASTAAVNAAVMPVVSRYVDDLQTRLAGERFKAPFYIMQSNGGVMNAEAARTKPVYMVESGPAAGVIAAGALAQAQGHNNVISFDMGGTTAKVGLVIDGQPKLSTEYEVGAQAASPSGEGKGSGYPVRTQVIDLVEVGAGGGSMAWIDPGGSLRVGPASAGAVPGPVCYGAGGEQPTITDANLVLGRLDPLYFLGGELKLDADAARTALQDKIAAPLGMDHMACADGILEIANASMMAAMRLISVQRGYDPREFVLVAFGGAGPLHANSLADAMGLPTVLIPPSPGVASAVGLLMTDIKHEFVATRRQLLESTPAGDVHEVFRGFEETAARLLGDEREDWLSVSLMRTMDLRYRGQSHELQVALPGGELGEDELALARTQFEDAHQRAYGYVAPDDPIELVNLRLTAVAKLPELTRKTIEMGTGDPAPAIRGRRNLWFRETGKEEDCPVYDRYKMRAGDSLKGPALIEEMDSCTVVLPGYGSIVDEHGNLVISRR